MSLRRQLLWLSLLLLSVPWAGCQFLRETDAILRESQTQALQATAEAAAAVLNAELAALIPTRERLINADSSNQAIYFHALSAPIFIDGYAEDWASIPAQQLSLSDTFHLRWQAGIYRDQLALYIHVQDPSLQHFSPARSSLGNGDRVELILGDDRRIDLSSSAPGDISPRFRSPTGIQTEGRIQAYWQDLADGYAIELRMPLQLTRERLAIHAIDANAAGGRRALATAPSEPAWVVYPPPALQARLKLFLRPGLNLRVVDRQHWMLADQGGLAAAADIPNNWWLRRLYQLVLGETQPEPRPQPQAGQLFSEPVATALEGEISREWYHLDRRSQGGVLHLAVPLRMEGEVVAVLLAEQSRAQSLALTDGAFGELLLLSFSAMGITAAGLLGYAGWLSWRVRRLQRAVGEAMREDGSIRDAFPQSRLPDELGELSRSSAELLKRLREYTEYLKSLSRKLSHELRTPIAIVRSSLDNLRTDPDSETYRLRASEGIERLGRLVTAMSEATRVEESIRQAQLETCDLAELLKEMIEGYQAVYPQTLVWENLSDGPVLVAAVPELLAQMLDKLLDNATDFAPEHSRISVRLLASAQAATIEVENPGPALPAELADRLFDNLVSIRAQSGGAHLGLGLHIVKLIVDYHQGSVTARNNDQGVVFSVVLPR